MKEPVEVFEYAPHIIKSLASGILLTTKNGAANTMTIGWGCLGIDWQLPVFIAFVRSSRLTYEYLLANPQFSVNVPMGNIDSRILAVCGTKSGREMDKIANLDLHLEPGEKISVPGIRELPLTLECNVIYKQAQEPAAIPQNLRDKFYPPDGGDPVKRRNNSYHTAFYGEIVAAYIIK